MRTVASFIFTSLDGFYEGPNGELDWPNVDAEFDDFAIRQLDAAATLGFGRVTYEHMAGHWPTEQAQANNPAITSRMNGMDKVVFSRTLTEAGWAPTTVLPGEAVDHVAELRNGSGKDVLIMGSPHLTAELLAKGLLDELRIMIFPIVLGRGRSLFEDLDGRVPLTRLAAQPFDSGNVLLTYTGT